MFFYMTQIDSKVCFLYYVIVYILLIRPLHQYMVYHYTG